MRRKARYRGSARFYDLISAEWPVYRAGRVAAIDLLALKPGENVLDLGCGTGLNFSHIQQRIGPTGSITAVDASAHMLDQARRRTRSAGWNNVSFVEADGTKLNPCDLGGADTFDAALSTYVLSLMADWPRALATMIDLTHPGGRVAVVDMQKPVGYAAVWTPLAQLACLMGGSDINAHPWTLIDSSLTDVRAASARGGHVQVRVGSVDRTSGHAGSRSTHDDPES
ncbi:class I SAM-dependent methyltransferase [Rhodococcus sp. WMMA185]|uniref:class I SAM-dependent methyltransferase n=1 Tax=Rhodococcus sp. WMMA185 TaxID=679318 RepID=UPI0008783F39|nr:methyltransferase domain-containing protein [Rhodococcus sp. WMMA185]